jgi:hypothetical protein
LGATTENTTVMAPSRRAKANAADGSGFRQQPSRIIVGLATELKKYLAMHPEARVIVIDMSNPFRNILRKHCSQLVIVVDPYHVKQLLEDLMPKICDPLAKGEAEGTAQSDPRQQNLFGHQGPPRALNARGRSQRRRSA